MKNYIPRSISFVVDSNPANGVENLSAAASSFDRFRVNLSSQPLTIPRDAQNVTLSVESTSIWNVTPNIVTGQNDTLRVTGPNTLDVLTVYYIVVPQGNYSVSQLNQSIQTALSNAGAKISPDPLISLTPDEATSKIEIRLNYATVVVDFTQPNSMWEILGFLATTVLGPGAAGQSYLAPNTARFNVVNYFLVSCSLAGSGLRFNNRYQSIICKSEINARPGSLSINEFINPSQISVQELAGQTRNEFIVSLLKDDFSPANTNSEYFSVRFSISYLEAV